MHLAFMIGNLAGCVGVVRISGRGVCANRRNGAGDLDLAGSGNSVRAGDLRPGDAADVGGASVFAMGRRVRCCSWVAAAVFVIYQ